MSRWYYDCPIKAAFMAKQYGLRVGYWRASDKYPFVQVAKPTVQELEMSGANGKYQIHPSSVKKLEKLPDYKKEALSLCGLWPEQEKE